nr:MAG TPA: hypothetical protein [Caudoviricetes sp.]
MGNIIICVFEFLIVSFRPFGSNTNIIGNSNWNRQNVVKRVSHYIESVYTTIQTIVECLFNCSANVSKSQADLIHQVFHSVLSFET